MELPVDTEEKLLEALEHTKGDLKLTNDEEKRLTKAFKEPEFKKLLGEYMQEISDPKNRAEYEQYIAEQERDVPKNMQIIKPKSGFVVKCRKRGPKAADGDAADEKLFINVCSAAEVEKPSSRSTTIAKAGKRGTKTRITLMTMMRIARVTGAIARIVLGEEIARPVGMIMTVTRIMACKIPPRKSSA